MIRYLFLIALLSAAVPVQAADPWLLAFPDLSFDTAHAFFSGEQWTAFYTPQLGTLVTVPRDSLEARGLLPDPVKPTGIAYTQDYSFVCDDNMLVSRSPDGKDTVRTLPPPTSDAIACLEAAGAKNIEPAALEEAMGPAFGTRSVLWFGLTLRDPGSKALAGGIGWFDPATGLFGRTYTPSLAGYRPEWIGARDDTVYALFKRQSKSSKRPKSLLLAFEPSSEYLAEINLARQGVPGKEILSIAQWNDTLLIATDCAVAIWTPKWIPLGWHTSAWASNRTTMLYLKTFPGGDPDKSKETEYLPLRSNVPTEVKAQIGGWLQVVAPVGIEGYVDAGEWEKHQVLWSQRSWACGDSLCFARLRVPMKGEIRESDFTNTPLTYIDRDREGVKVGFKAAWAKQESMAPVMVPVR